MTVHYTLPPENIADWATPLPDAVCVCKLPNELGRITKLSVKNGKVLAETESGIPFIVPHLSGA